MAVIAEYPTAPPERQAAIADLASRAALQLQATTIVALAFVIDRSTTSTLPAVTIPTIHGFNAEQATLLVKSLEWLAAHFPRLMPRRALTVSPWLGEPGINGHVSTWTGDILISSAIVRDDNVAEFTGTLAHELMHAKSDRLGRIKQGYDIVLGRTEEHDFLQAAGLAVRDIYKGPLAVAERGLTFDAASGQPVLARSDGSGRIELPAWSAVREAFLADWVWLHIEAQ